MTALRPLLLTVLLGLVPAGPVLAASPDARTLAQQAFATLQARYPDADASWKSGQAGPEVVTGLQVDVPGARTPEARARGFLASCPGLLGIGDADLRFTGVSQSRAQVVAQFVQTAATPAGRVPVLDRHVAVTMDASGRVVVLASDAVAIGAIAAGKITAAQAQATVLREVDGVRVGSVVTDRPVQSAQVVVAFGNRAYLAWAVDVTVTPRIDRRLFVVDAATGRVMSQKSLVQH